MTWPDVVFLAGAFISGIAFFYIGRYWRRRGQQSAIQAYGIAFACWFIVVAVSFVFLFIHALKNSG